MALYTLKSGVNNHPEDSVLQHLTDITRKGGVINPSTDFIVGEHGAGGLIVDVSTGHMIIKGSNTSAYPVRNTAVANINITSNSSGNPRITTVVVYIDTAATPVAENGGNDVAKFMAVNGTPGASPSAPTDADIQSAVGVNNPFVRRADITVASGATGISAANINNNGPRVYLYSPSPRVTLTYAATVTPDFSASNKCTLTLTDNVTFAAPSNMEVGDLMEIETIQPVAGGKTITWFSGITWLSPDTSNNTDSNKKTTYLIEKIGTSTYNGYLGGKEY